MLALTTRSRLQIYENVASIGNQKKVNASKHMLLRQKLKEQNDTVATLENDKVILQEEIEEFKSKQTVL